ncbi:MAG: hypothetical protein K2X39_04670, partial [Silvanigrellaceae bacterium]|nr:hypothetical protein [Silvanigrellaceae bacterium]
MKNLNKILIVFSVLTCDLCFVNAGGGGHPLPIPPSSTSLQQELERAVQVLFPNSPRTQFGALPSQVPETEGSSAADATPALPNSEITIIDLSNRYANFRTSNELMETLRLYVTEGPTRYNTLSGAASNFAQNLNIMEINLSGQRLSPEVIYFIADHFPNLRVLNLDLVTRQQQGPGNNPLEAFINICLYRYGFFNLEQLHMGGIDGLINSYLITGLAQVIATLKRLTTLDLSHNPILGERDAFAIALSHSISSPLNSLRTLDLSFHEMEMTEPGVLSLKSALSFMPNLERLNISHTNGKSDNDRDYYHVTTNFYHSLLGTLINLKALSISTGGKSGLELRAFAQAVIHAPRVVNLRELNITTLKFNDQDMKVVDTSIEVLAVAFKYLSILTSFSFSNSCLTDEQIGRLTHGLALLPKLETL